MRLISGANGLSSKETWFPRTNGPKFPRKHASLGNGPKVMGKPWFCGGNGLKFWRNHLGQMDIFHSLDAIFFSSFHSTCNLSSIQCKRLYQLFHPYYATVFSIFHCQILHNVDKNYKIDELLCTFYRTFIEQLGQGEYKSSLLREVVTPLSSCDN